MVKATRKCSIDGCDQPRKSRGWCEMHYYRWRRNGDPLKLKMGEFPDLCTVEGCDRDFYARGWCNVHYTRWRIHGDPFGFAKPKLKEPCSVDKCGKASDSLGYCKMHYTRLRRHGDVDTVLSLAGPKRTFEEELAINCATAGPDDCWIWTGHTDRAGYGRVYAYATNSDEYRLRFAHRVSYEHFVGPIPDEKIIMHSCDNPPCINPNHLSPGTNQDNARDMVRKGRSARGVKHRAAKLTERQVIEAREAYYSGEATLTQLSQLYGLTLTPMRQALHGITWKHIPLQTN